MFCCKCGYEMPDEGVFCPECGAKQEPQQASEFPAHEEAPTYEEAPAYAEAPELDVQYDSDSRLCESCGAVIPLDSRFCPECRARQSTVFSAPRAGTGVPAALAAKTKAVLQKLITPDMKAAFQKYRKWISLAAAGAGALCLILILVFALSKPRINLNKYVTVYAEGYDGYGYVQWEFDYDRFCEDYGKELAKAIMPDRLKQTSTGIPLSGLKTNTAVYPEACDIFLEECVDMHLFNGDLLSNGDKFSFHWICKDATALNKYGFKLRYKDITKTVRSLQEAKYFDPFEGVEITFEGVSPYGRAYLEADPVAPEARNMDYRLDVSDNLSNGDTVTISVRGSWSDPINYYLQNYGMLPSSLTKEVTVSGLGSYVTEKDQVTEEALESLLQQTQDIYKARMAQNPQQGETLVSFDYLGNYLLVNKDREMFGGDSNRLYLVYKVRMRNNYSSNGNIFDKTTDLYWFVRFNNVMVDDSGAVTADLTSYYLPDEDIRIDSGIDKVRWDYRGYSSLQEMYADVVAASVEVYICSSTVPAE